MIVEFTGRFAKHKQDLICEAIAFGAHKMFPDAALNADPEIFINIEATTKKGLCGDCMFWDDNEFTIRLNKSLSISELVTTVLHELVHVSQYLKGMAMDTTSAYKDRWHEIEAHAMEKLLKEEFDGHRGY